MNKKKEIDLVTGQQFKIWAGPYSAHYYPAPISVWTKKHPIIPSPKLSLSVCTKAHSIVLSPKRCVSVDHEFKVLLQSLFPIQSIHFQVRYNRLDVEKITRNFFLPSRVRECRIALYLKLIRHFGMVDLDFLILNFFYYYFLVLDFWQQRKSER